MYTAVLTQSVGDVLSAWCCAMLSICVGIAISTAEGGKILILI